MKAIYRIFCLIVFAALLVASRAQTPAPAPANAAAPPSAPAQPSEADLEKLVAPIALYPDPLLATLLPASAYPLDIVKASRFLQDTNNISRIDSQPWDPNVKALARFPDVLKKMNEDIDWTSDLGDAFVNNQKGVMNAIQVMRNKANDAGNLKTTEQQVVTVTNNIVQETVNNQVVVVTNTVVQIQPATPGVVYVPYYSPAVVYAAPAPGYYAAASMVSFGAGMMWGAAIANSCNWHSGDVNINHNYNRNVNNTRNNANYNRNNANNNNRNYGQNGTRRANTTGTAQANRNGASRSGGAYGGGNYGGGNAGGQKWQADPSRRTSNPGASQASRGYGGGGNANAGRGDAFSNYGGGQQTRAASNRGAASSGNAAAGGGTRSFGGGTRSGGGNVGGGGVRSSGGGARSGGGFRGGGGGRRGR